MQTSSFNLASGRIYNQIYLFSSLRQPTALEISSHGLDPEVFLVRFQNLELMLLLPCIPSNELFDHAWYLKHINALPSRDLSPESIIICLIFGKHRSKMRHTGSRTRNAQSAVKVANIKTI